MYFHHVTWSLRIEDSQLRKLSVGLFCAKVCISPFTKGKKQLTRHEVDWSREISHVRVHVERVIGQLKNFTSGCDSYHFIKK